MSTVAGTRKVGPVPTTRIRLHLVPRLRDGKGRGSAPSPGPARSESVPEVPREPEAPAEGGLATARRSGISPATGYKTARREPRTPAFGTDAQPESRVKRRCSSQAPRSIGSRASGPADQRREPERPHDRQIEHQVVHGRLLSTGVTSRTLRVLISSPPRRTDRKRKRPTTGARPGRGRSIHKPEAQAKEYSNIEYSFACASGCAMRTVVVLRRRRLFRAMAGGLFADRNPRIT